jgi:gliding motility-associated-like protein
MKKIALFFFVFASISCFAQFSKTHFIPPLTAQTNFAEDQYLYISTPNTTTVNIKIIELGGAVINGVVSNTSPLVHFIGQGDTSQLFTPKTSIGIIQNKGYIIEAEDLVYVSVRVNAALNNNGGYNHAGGLVSKGNSALGTTFRLGAMLNPLYDTSLLNFASVLATENNTTITISNIPPGTLFSDGIPFPGSITVTLNKDESYVLALENIADGNPISNSSKMIGALVEADKPVAVNSGSFGGSNSKLLRTNNDGDLVTAGRDLGFDQIVDFEKTGTEYIFVKGLGTDDIERVLLIAQNPNTIIYLNGSTASFGVPLNAGDFITIDGSQFVNGNLYVTTSQKVFAYQSIGGLAPSFFPSGNPSNYPPANQNLFFVPPINCSTPNTVDNIPLIQSIGSTNFNGGLNIVTEAGALVKINGYPTTAVPVPLAANGKPNFVRYTIDGLSGNVSVKSEKQVYVSYFGTNGAATYGGYYSGFDLKPEIVSDKINVSNSSCIPNIELKINTLSSYDVFQWYKNGNAIDPILYPDAITRRYKPDVPGYYKVKGSISACGTTISSDEIPVSYCPTDLDNDKANDNIDVDNDNDGILNCDESYGDQPIDVSDSSSGNITVNVDKYSNSFDGEVSKAPPGLPAGTFTGSTDGSFVTEIPAGKGNSVTYKMTFEDPISVGIEYANLTDLLNANAEYVINSDVNQTVTVLNPNDELLIDTNYDGIYENGVTAYSSFEIRFRLNSAATATETFKFLSYLANSISFTHINLSETDPNTSTLKIFAVCVPKDSDSDGITDQLDTDSDNDGIPDITEAHGNSAISLLNSDTDNNGLDNAFTLGFTPVDTDLDGIADYLDLDSDNDGILDIVETASDLDRDGIPNYRDLDSDGDVCTDVIEAGFTDADKDGLLGGIAPPDIDLNGMVTSGIGYSTPDDNYITPAPIEITTQPLVAPTCELQNATITVTDNGVDKYQWQLFSGGIWTDIVDNATYGGALTDKLELTSVTNSMNNYKYRVQLEKTGNSCGLASDETTFTVYSLPVITTPVLLIQCDDVDAAPDGIATFNLTQNNSFISANSATENFTYFTDPDAANSNDTTLLIPNPLTFVSANTSVWVRIKNSNECIRVARLDLIVSVTKLPNSFVIPNQHKCDDYLDATNNQYDGVASFDFTSIFNSVQAELIGPTTNYSIKFYKNINDFNAETDSNGSSLAISDITNYRNSDAPDQQTIWLRVESTLDNSCFGSKAFTTIVEPTPVFNTVGLNNIIRNCDDNQDGIFGFDTSTLKNDILQGQNNIDLTYFDDVGNQLSPLPNPFFVNTTKTITVKMTNNPSLALDGPCYYEEKITFIVDELPKKFVILITDMTDVNTISVNVNESGNYEYSLDEPSGYFQDSNFFTDVPAGIHTVYINDKNGCGLVSKTIAVVGVPKFFSPNGDGYNDYWSVKGVNDSFNTKSVIYIFDRYGKLLKQWVPASSEGWDGNFNGSPMPGDDYWYKIKLEDGREAKGNFSLKR